jgi:uncharacterized cysteine cluster protein YcgN (CxxCxxCC family)
MQKKSEPFWQTKALKEMSPEEWESLCDRCGLCCLHTLQDETTEVICLTCVSCRFLDIERCCCTVYHDPYVIPSYCRKITPDNIRQLDWLPDTCAYRLVAEQKKLPWWHHLISGDPESVHRSGISARNKAISERHVHPDDMENFIIT